MADKEKQTATETIIRDIRFIDIDVRFVMWLSDEQEAVTWGIQRFVNIGQIKKVVFDRFVAEFIRARKDIFVSSGNALFVLYQIGTYGAEPKQAINSSVLDLLEKEPKYIGKLIGGFLIEFPGVGPNGFQMDGLKSVYDPSRLADLARQAGSSAWSNDKEKRAIEMFLREDGAEKSHQEM